jgi:hypothetical protein
MKVLYIAPLALLLGGCITPPLFGNPFANKDVGLLCSTSPSESYPTRNCGEAREVAAANPPSAAAPEKPGSGEKPSTPDKPDVPDKPDKPDRPDKPDKPDRPDKPDKPDRPGHGHGDDNHDHQGPPGQDK